MTTIRTYVAILAFFLFANTSFAAELENICRYCGRDHSLQFKNAAAAGQDAGGRQYAPDRLVDVKHIKIDVTPDFKQRTVAGVTTLTFSAISKPVEEVTLDAEMLDVTDVQSSVPLADYVATDHHLTLLFRQPIQVGQQVEVTITYTAEPQKGLYFRTPELGYPEEDTHIWTQGETHEAPHWFPCFDYPNERSTTEVLCTVPDGMVVLSNGKRMGEESRSAGTKTVRWVQDKPHVSYLVCLVAGKFHELKDQHRDVPLGFYAQPSLAEHAKNAFADTRAIMEFYEAEIGMNYPWDKYYQATIRDFNSGGMENTSLTTLTHGTIYSEVTENIRSSRNLDAHEMAHQWFGDYVTCEDWSHLWLNEGFATYYTHLYNEHKLGRDELLYGLYRDAKNRVLPEGDDHRPIVFRGYDNAWEQFDYRAYPKGSWVLHMLRNQLGKDVYRTAIKNYLEANALSSVVTADLIAALEDVSGQELDRFFDQWVFHAGAPDLKIKHKWLPKEKLVQVTVEQTQDVNDNVLLFDFPAKLRFYVGDNVIDHAIDITQKQQDFYVPLDAKPELVRFDPEYTVLAKVDFDKPQIMLERQLENQDDVIGRLLAADKLGEKESKKTIAALKQALNNDPHYGVRIAAADALEEIGSNESFAALTESQQQSDARVRQAVVRNVGKFYKPDSLTAMKRIVNNEANPAIVSVAVRALGKFRADDARAEIEKALDTESFGNEIAGAAIEALADSGDEALRGKLLNVLKSQRNDFGDRDYSQGLGALAKLWREADDQAPARSWIEDCLRDPSRRVRSGAVAALGELGDPRAIASLRSFADREGRGRDTTAAEKAIKKLEDQTPFVPREVKELREMVGDMQEEQEKLRKELDELKGKAEAKSDAA